MELILFMLTLVLCFLLGYVAGKRKCIKAVEAALYHELKLPTSDYQKGWLDCLAFVMDRY